MSLSQLEHIAKRLEADNLRLEAQALRAVARRYKNMSLSDLIALVAQVSENPSPIYRVSQLNRLMDSFYGAVSELETPPTELAELLTRAVTTSVGAAEAMIQTAGGVLEMFRVPPTRQLEFTQHASERLQVYWTKEQRRLADDVQSVLLEGLERGQGARQVASNLLARQNVSKSRAELIARNELGNAAGFAMRESQQDAGATHYIWRSASDHRVRPEHRARNGETFAWDDPPSDGHPGEPIQCRCVALFLPPEGE